MVQSVQNVVLDQFEMALRSHAGLAGDVMLMGNDQRVTVSGVFVAVLAACAKRSSHDNTAVVDAMKRRVSAHFKMSAARDHSAWLRSENV